MLNISNGSAVPAHAYPTLWHFSRKLLEESQKFMPHAIEQPQQIKGIATNRIKLPASISPISSKSDRKLNSLLQPLSKTATLLLFFPQTVPPKALFLQAFDFVNDKNTENCKNK
jgi:hypothetical protein